MNIKDFNEKCHDFLKNIKEEDGLYNYYQHKLYTDKNIFNERELIFIKYFMEKVDKKCKILEIGAGLGSLSHYLNLNGFNNITINEFDKKRMDLAKLLNNKFKNSCNLAFIDFKKMKLHEYDYIFCVNGKTTYLGSKQYIPIFEKIIEQGVKLILVADSLGETKEGALLNNIYKHEKEEHYLNSSTEFTDCLINKYNFYIIETVTSDVTNKKIPIYVIYKDTV